MTCNGPWRFIFWVCCGEADCPNEQRRSPKDCAEIVYEVAIDRGWSPSRAEQQAVRRAIGRLSWADAATVQCRLFTVGICSAVAGAIVSGWLVPLGWGVPHEHPAPAQWYAVFALFCVTVGAEIFVVARRALIAVAARAVSRADQMLARLLPGYTPSASAPHGDRIEESVTDSRWFLQGVDAAVLAGWLIGGLIALIGEFALLSLAGVVGVAWMQGRRRIASRIDRAATAWRGRGIGPDIERIH